MALTLASIILFAIQVFQKFLIIKFAVPAVNLWNLFFQVDQIALRKTAHHKEFLDTTFGLGLSKFQDGIDTFFLSIVDKTAGVYHYDFALRVVAIVCNLQQHYDVQGMFHAETLYGSNLPIRVDMPDVTDGDITCFFLDIDKQRHMRLFNFSRNNTIFSDVEVEGEMYDTLSTPLGRIYVEPSRFYYTPDRSIEVHHDLLQSTLNAYQQKLTVATATDNRYKFSICQQIAIFSRLIPFHPNPHQVIDADTSIIRKV